MTIPVMPSITCVDYCDKYGEWQFFLTEDNKIIDFWSRNDAHFRTEYMGHLINYLGFAVVDIGYTDLCTEAKGVIDKKLKKIMGY